MSNWATIRTMSAGVVSGEVAYYILRGTSGNLLIDFLGIGISALTSYIISRWVGRIKNYKEIDQKLIRL